MQLECFSHIKRNIKCVILIFLMSGSLLYSNYNLSSKNYIIKNVKEPYYFRYGQGEKMKLQKGSFIVENIHSPIITRDVRYYKNGKYYNGELKLKEVFYCPELVDTIDLFEKGSVNCIKGQVVLTILENYDKYNEEFDCNTTNNPIVNVLDLLLRALIKNQNEVEYFNDLDALNEAIKEEDKNKIFSKFYIKEKFGKNSALQLDLETTFNIPNESIVVTEKQRHKKSKFINVRYCNDFVSFLNYLEGNSQICVAGKMERQFFFNNNYFANIELNAEGELNRNWGKIDVSLPYVEQYRNKKNILQNGYYTYADFGDDGVESHLFGIDKTISAIKKAALALKKEGIYMGVGDISKKGGGPLPGHSSHWLGTDVDLRLISSNGFADSMTYNKSENYSREMTKKMIEKLIDTAGIEKVKVIFFNDKWVIDRINKKYGREIVKEREGHDNHVHVSYDF